MNYQTYDKPDRMVLEILLEETTKCTSFFTVSLPSSDNLVHFLGHTAIMNPFKYSIM